MRSLSEQYEIEVKQIDGIICQRLKNALQVDLGSEVKAPQEEQLSKKIKVSSDAIISLFEGNFADKEKVLREKIEQQEASRRRRRTDKYSQLANQILRKRVDSTIEEIIGEKNCGAIVTSVGIARRTLIDEVLDRNIDIQRGISVPEEYEDR